MEKVYKVCQSCGMPLKKDVSIATNVDGSKNFIYCSHCYQHGAFTLPNITAVEMQERVLRKMIEMGFPRFLGKFFTKGIQKLERWK